MSLVNDLQWRYATKKMNGEKVQQEKIEYIMEAARLAPSSSGLQPYRIIVISDAALLQKIKPIAYQQAQLDGCSHLLVWASWDSYSEDKITTVFNEMMDMRGLPRQTMDSYKATIWSMYESLGTEWQKHHAAKQAYISVGLAAAAAAEVKVDTTPMEEFNTLQLDELLNLSGTGFTSTVIMPIGYRDAANDWLVGMEKFRTPKDRFVTEMDLSEAATLLSEETSLNIDGIFAPKN